ncbi:hypothetical protein CN378_05940 [Bacillus sp. AFS015802]|uniref:hypothetical protein n=1 Tax=Bacillus sp. AFS015802 TaxID=2033486 RepID=UPI000BF52C33|nr:hypothetical protein [Bacillus sp. AFS015802]PFA68746.1 hypothetical protein CN378_05940 [Bacillus sp. AFS015802]
MNADRQDKNQQLRMVQSLYRRKKQKLKRNKVSKIWTLFIVIFFLVALFILTINELIVADPATPVPEFLSKFLSKLSATFHLVF